MSNCPIELDFSKTHCDKRLNRAHQTFGIKTVTRIIGFTLFLLGAKREDIAQHLKIPLGTFLSFLTRIDQYGLMAFQDRRRLAPTPAAKPKTQPAKACVALTEDTLTLELPDNILISIPRQNRLQCKTILLTFVNNGLLTAEEVADILKLSERHTRDLETKLNEGDVYALIDKRQGQLQDYRFTPEIKAELIQQVAANAITGTSTSSRAISQQIKERCNLVLPDRSVRLHMNKLGLPKLSHSLPALVEAFKKNSTT